MTTPKPPKYVEIEELLGEPLKPLVSLRRREGVSWRRIAQEITNRTAVDIAGETIRVWHEGRDPISGSAA